MGDFFVTDDSLGKGAVSMEVAFGTGLRSYSFDDMVTIALKAHHPSGGLDSTYTTNRQRDRHGLRDAASGEPVTRTVVRWT